MPQRPAPKTKVYAVITGDIVGSTKRTAPEMKKVRAAISEAMKRFDARHFYLDRKWEGVEFSQGDSWQIVLGNPSYALRLALSIQASLRHQTNAETRMAIGIGTVDSLERTAGISTGEAFTLSGRALESLSSTFRLTGALPKRAEILVEWFPGLLHLCGALMRSWTKRQAEVMGHWLTWPNQDLADVTYEAVAAELSITKQSVGDILSSAHLPPLRDALMRFQKTDWQRVAGPQHERKA